MKRILPVLAITIGCFMEGAAFFLLTLQDGFWWASLLLHISGTLVFSYGLFPFTRPEANLKGAVIFITAVMGIFGCAGMIFVVIMLNVRKGKGEVFHLDIDEAEEAAEEEEEDFDDELFTPRQLEILEIESFTDILHSDDKELRLGAITALQKLKDRDSIALLTESLNSRYHEVRYYAVEALNQIAQEYLDKISVLKVMTNIKPSDNVIRRTLGDNYFEYAFKGIEEASIQAYYYKLALEEYLVLFKSDDEDNELLEKIMIIASNLKLYEESLKYANMLLARKSTNLAAIKIKADSLIIRKEFDLLERFCRELMNNSDLPAAVRQSAEMWI